MFSLFSMGVNVKEHIMLMLQRHRAQNPYPMAPTRPIRSQLPSSLKNLSGKVLRVQEGLGAEEGGWYMLIGI